MSNPIIKINTGDRKTTSAQKSSAIKPTQSLKQLSSPRPIRSGQSVISNQNSGNTINSIQAKSKIATDRKPSSVVTSSRSRTLQETTKNVRTTKNSPRAEGPGKPLTPKHTPRIWNRRESPRVTKVKSVEKIQTPRTIPQAEAGIQTNEAEILNRDLIIGDIKLLVPSKVLVEDIEREREETKKKALMKMQRKFEEHAERQEEHLTDLQEFLDKGVVTRRLRKPKEETIMVDKNLINSLDDIFNRSVPRAESMTDIKARIKRKEKELLSLFDTVENVQNLSSTN